MSKQAVFDCHTHIAEMSHLSGPFLAAAQRAWGADFHFACTIDEHKAAVASCSGAIVLAVDAPATGFVVPNEYVAGYVASSPSRLFGFASVDPKRPKASRLLEQAIKELNLKGLKLAPIYQDFHPLDNICFPLYAKAEELRLPVMWHQGTSFVSEGPLEKSRPAALDPIARAFPNLKMIIAHLGHPWVEETISVVRKHPNMYTDISALGSRPWQMYNAIILAIEYGIEDKLLFGSDFPFSTPDETLRSLYGLNEMVEGTRLPRIREDVIERMLARNTVELLGLN
ncbi:amidohydrolase family protein [Paenibacillus senegalensis]|uniref:amidohydrolase family protein n=1 Tax=Paenibacillus senegalensis TaxID=1465766 RepID=UPI00028A33D3|nr:amidohydrolase family protein [Paenibacillus senegalensis]